MRDTVVISSTWRYVVSCGYQAMSFRQHRMFVFQLHQWVWRLSRMMRRIQLQLELTTLRTTCMTYSQPPLFTSISLQKRAQSVPLVPAHRARYPFASETK
jgi:hypothetical protein